MTFVKRYLIPRLIQYILVIWLGITVVFLIPRIIPNDPVMSMIAMMRARGSTLEPGAMDGIIHDLTEMYGLQGSWLDQYWALYPSKQSGNCFTRAIFLSTSTDGINWTTYPTPVLVSGELSALADIVYRSTFRYLAETDEVRFWFSGATAVDNTYDWRTVLQRRRRSDVLARISSPPTFALRPRMNVLPPMSNPP